MKIDKYWKLRLKKWWITKVMKLVYPKVPFEIAYTDIAESYETMLIGSSYKTLATFDSGGKHWIIYETPSLT